MKYLKLSLCLTLLCFSIYITESKTIFRRTDKISENFKQLDLAPEEIDPNVAPPEPQKIETLDPEDVIQPAAAEQIDEQASNDVNEVVDESINEIIPPEPAAAAPVVEDPAPAAAAPAVATTNAAKPTKTPSAVSTEEAATDSVSPLSRFCKCSGDACDCCRTFNVPLLPIRGPGCARLAYLGKDRMSVSVKYGDLTLAQRTISTKRARPICMGLPGDNEFCGRIYGVSKAKENFKACLGFEFRNDDEVRAALRVSCFKFGPEGLKVAEAEPLPSELNEEEEDDDIFGFGGGDDDDDEDDYDDADDIDDPDDADDEPDSLEDDDETDAPADADYGGFSLGDLIDELDDDDDEEKPSKPTSTNSIVSGITPPPAVDLTRIAEGSESVQSKDDKEAASLPADGVTSAQETVDAVSTVTTAVVTGAPASKPSKSKKSKKSKKKKAVSNVETDFAYELFNGILDFFN